MVFPGCSNQKDFELKTGDLLFRGKTSSSLSTAIDDVTRTVEGKHFSHVGLVEVTDGEVFVIHADGPSGVRKESLIAFMADGKGESLYVEAYRLRGKWNGGISEAIKRASGVIGEPYNYTYIIEDSGYYCSELIWYAFAADSVFRLEPMTFKDPATGEFHGGWIEHYQKMGIEIPEGLPGCNPNGMAASEKLEFLGVVY
jgi:uncharacterized protein YycO